MKSDSFVKIESLKLINYLIISLKNLYNYFEFDILNRKITQSNSNIISKANNNFKIKNSKKSKYYICSKII